MDKTEQIKALETRQLELIKERDSSTGMTKNRLTRMLNDIIDQKMSLILGFEIKNKNW